MPQDHSAQETSAFIVYALCFPSEVTVDEARLIYASPSFHRAAALSMANRCSERRYGRTPMLMATMIAASICALSMAIGFIVRRQVTWSPACAGAPASVGAPGRWTSVASGLLKPDRAIAGLVIWLTLLDAALALAAPWPLKVVVDYGVGHRPLPPSLVWAGRLTPVGVAVAAAAAGLLLLLAGAVAGYLVTVLVATVGERMTVRLRGALVEHVLRAQPRAVAAYPLGELTSRLGGDAARVSDTVAAIVDTLVPDAALLAGMTTITAILDWRLTLVVLGIIPLYALTARLRNRALRGAQRQSRARSGELAAFAADLLARLPAVHVFGRAADETGRYNEASSQAARAAVAAVDAGARFIPVNDTLPGLGLAAALVAGTVEVASGRLTIGGLLVFLAYLSSLTGPVRSLARVSGVIARGTASRDRIAELLCLPPLRPVLVTRPPAGTRGRGRGLAISLERVSYAHQPGRPVLTSASLNVPGGSLVCVTGPSGSGKSTLLSLLVRLADPQSGRITVGGRDISGRIRGCTPAPSRTTSATGAAGRPERRSSPRPNARAWRPSPAACRTDTTPRSVNTGTSCPAASNAASPSAGRCCATAPCSSSTSRRPAWIPRRNPASSTTCSPLPAAGHSSSSATSRDSSPGRNGSSGSMRAPSPRLAAWT